MRKFQRAMYVIAVFSIFTTACSTGLGPSSGAEALRCVRPAPVAGKARYTWGTAGVANSDAWVARFEEGATRPAWRVQIAGTGEESISTVTPLNEREIAVVGSTTSPSLPGLAASRRSGRNGFILRLSASTGEVLSGSFAPNLGSDTEFHGATVLPDGTIGVAGVGGNRAAYEMPVLPRVRQIEIEGANKATARPLFLSLYTPELDREVGRIQVGMTSVKRPRVWVDCNGVPVVGTVALANGECAGGWPDLVYQQGEFANNYDMDHDWNQTAALGYPPGGWGFHALRWKAHHAPAFTLNPWPPSGNEPAVPKSSVPSCADTQALNSLESSHFAPPDPGGWWQCGQHSQMSQLALAATFLMSRWTTPVYTRVQRWDNLNGPWVKTGDSVAVERVVWHPVCPWNPNAYTGQKIEDLCNLTVDNVVNIGCQASDIIGGLAGNGFLLKFERFEGTRWYNGPTVWYQRPMSYAANASPWYHEWYEPGDYVFDPPAGSENEQAMVKEAARQMASGVVRAARVVITSVDDGRVTNTKIVDALVPAD